MSFITRLLPKLVRVPVAARLVYERGPAYGLRIVGRLSLAQAWTSCLGGAGLATGLIPRLNAPFLQFVSDYPVAPAFVSVGMYLAVKRVVETSVSKMWVDDDKVYVEFIAAVGKDWVEVYDGRDVSLGGYDPKGLQWMKVKGKGGVMIEHSEAVEEDRDFFTGR